MVLYPFQGIWLSRKKQNELHGWLSKYLCWMNKARQKKIEYILSDSFYVKSGKCKLMYSTGYRSMVSWEGWKVGLGGRDYREVEELLQVVDILIILMVMASQGYTYINIYLYTFYMYFVCWWCLNKKSLQTQKKLCIQWIDRVHIIYQAL